MTTSTIVRPRAVQIASSGSASRTRSPRRWNDIIGCEIPTCAPRVGCETSCARTSRVMTAAIAIGRGPGEGFRPEGTVRRYVFDCNLLDNLARSFHLQQPFEAIAQAIGEAVASLFSDEHRSS